MCWAKRGSWDRESSPRTCVSIVNVCRKCVLAYSPRRGMPAYCLLPALQLASLGEASGPQKTSGSFMFPLKTRLIKRHIKCSGSMAHCYPMETGGTKCIPGFLKVYNRYATKGKPTRCVDSMIQHSPLSNHDDVLRASFPNATSIEATAQFVLLFQYPLSLFYSNFYLSYVKRRSYPEVIARQCLYDAGQ